MVNFGVAFIPSPEDFETWPEGWKYTDLEPFYREVLEATDVSTEASTDGELYLRTAGDIVNGVMKKHLGFTEASLNADPFNRVNVSTLPEQQVKNGQRHESCLVSFASTSLGLLACIWGLFSFPLWDAWFVDCKFQTGCASSRHICFRS